MLSPGVFITEIDASTIVPTVSNSIGIFGGDYVKGPVGTYTLISSVADLITYYGQPTNTNYNDWYQTYNFLQYGNKLLVSRAADVGGTATLISGNTVTTGVTANTTAVVAVTTPASFTVGDLVSFTEDTVTSKTFYEVTVVGVSDITLDRNIENALIAGDKINTFSIAMNGVFEAVDSVAAGEAVVNASEYVNSLMVIENASDYDVKETSIAFINTTDSKLKLIARNPGAWSSSLEIAIATPSAFGNTVGAQAFTGISLDDLFAYAPTGTEVGIVVKDGDVIVETWTVDFDPTAKDHNGKSTYVETVINNNSSYIFAKDNTSNADSIKNYCYTWNGTAYTGSTISLVYGMDSTVGVDDIANAYDIFANKEELDIDIVIGNETDSGAGAFNLCDTRKDCIGFIGASYGDTVGKKAATATTNLITWKKTGDIANYVSMFMVACGNYKYQYDRYNDKYRWVNIAGDIAGLRAQTSMNRASWWASAGLERGQIKNVTKLAFNPTQGQRDLLYKNSINPIVSFPGQGTVMWGQKTLLDKPSSFDRVNVRGLFNTMERALGKMAKYQVMEFNDNFTRNRIVSMIKPYLSSVQAGRGIQDFLVICDESNNTADVISRNQLVVDIYIKPTYVAEFIQLRFTNAGTNSFAQVIGG